MNIGERNPIRDQRSHNKQFNLYERLQDEIRIKTGVLCSILVTPEHVSVRTANYADWILARAELRKLTKQPIIRDE